MIGVRVATVEERFRPRSPTAMRCITVGLMVLRMGGGQYLMTTRPSILPCFISSKTALISPRLRVETVGWI